MLHDHEKHGVSTSHHNHYHMAHVFKSIVLLHITDCAICVYYENLDWGAAELEELRREFSLLIKLLKSSTNKVFHCHIHDSDFETLPGKCLTYRDHEQKEKGKALVQVHTNFAPVLQCFSHCSQLLPNTDRWTYYRAIA